MGKAECSVADVKEAYRIPGIRLYRDHYLMSVDELGQAPSSFLFAGFLCQINSDANLKVVEIRIGQAHASGQPDAHHIGNDW